MQDVAPLAVAYYMNGINFRLSAEKLAQDQELDSTGSAEQANSHTALFSGKPCCRAISQSSITQAWHARRRVKEF